MNDNRIDNDKGKHDRLLQLQQLENIVCIGYLLL